MKKKLRYVQQCAITCVHLVVSCVRADYWYDLFICLLACVVCMRVFVYMYMRSFGLSILSYISLSPFLAIVCICACRTQPLCNQPNAMPVQPNATDPLCIQIWPLCNHMRPLFIQIRPLCNQTRPLCSQLKCLCSPIRPLGSQMRPLCSQM